MYSDDSKEHGLQQTYVLTPTPSHEIDSEAGGPDFSRILRILWRRRKLILVGVILGGVLAFSISALLPKRYRSVAIMVVASPPFASELKPPVFSVETYQTIISSLSFLTSVRSQLEDGSKVSLETDVFSGRQPNQPPLPLISLVAEATSPTSAARAANLWADTVVSEIGDLSWRAQSEAVTLIQREFPEAGDRLRKSEKELLDTQNLYAAKIKQAQQYHDKLLSEFDAQWNLHERIRELDGLQTLLVDPADGLLGQLQTVRIAKGRMQQRLAELEKEIQKHPELLVLSKSIDENALWTAIAQDQSGAVPDRIGALELKTQEVNTVHRELDSQLAATKVEYETLIPLEELLTEQVTSLQERTAVLQQMIEAKDLERRNLERDRTEALALLSRERDFRLDDLKRTVDSYRSTYSNLAEKYQSGLISSKEQSADVRIASRAVENPTPVRPRMALNTALGLLIGAVLSIGLAVVLEYASNTDHPRSLVPQARQRKTLSEAAEPSR